MAEAPGRDTENGSCARVYDSKVEAGTRVEVRSRFDRAWARGFEVEEKLPAEPGAQYRVRRRSDGSVLPVLFDDHDVREEQRKNDMWWI
jgi:hypothetical protein